MPTRVIAKQNVVKSFEFAKIGRRALLITGKTGAVKSGALKDVTDALEINAVSYEIFNEIEENPSIENCYRAAMLAIEKGADFIIGIGGGSAMDAAKAAAVFATNGYEDMYEIYNGIPKRPLPLITVGTTSGTGSEVTAVSVITVKNEKGEPFKKSLKSPRLYPLYALVDPKYTYNLPWNITVATALDVLCHAVEALYSARAGEMSNIYAAEAIKRVWNAIKKAHWQTFVEFRNIDEEVRNELSLASIIAGMAINTAGTGFAHAAGYPFSTEKFVPHGLACAYFLVPYVKHMRGANEKLDKIFTDSLGYGFEEFYEDMKKLLPTPPALSYEEVEAYTEFTSKSASLSNSVVPLSKGELEKVYAAFINKN